ncbi:MAG: tetratricopeptide repeat protein, partial [Pirellulales bacterium]
MAIATAIGVATYFLGGRGVTVGAAVYLAYSIRSRIVIPRYHRRGIALVKQQQFADAIPLFRQSLEFFDRHAWIDRFRCVVLMSPSAVTYREMALANIGFCYSQIGDGDNARHYYAECLRRFPESGLARAALRMIGSGKSEKHTSTVV